MSFPGDENGNIVAFPSTEGPEFEAALWLGRVEEGLDPEQERAFQAWLASAPEHGAAWRAVASAWKEAAALADVFPKGKAAEVSSSSPSQGRKYALAPRPSLRAMTAGWLCLLSFVVLLGLITRTPDPSDLASAVRTEVGEQRTVALPDGSSATLNTATEVRFFSDDQIRRLELERGEVFLEVAKDPARPFWVITSAGNIRVTGTAFSVYLRDPQSLEVVVEEGEVQVSPLTASGTEAEADRGAPRSTSSVVAIRPGDRALLQEGFATVEALSIGEVKTALAWRDGLVMFTGEPLEEVVQHVGRYTDLEIKISDPEIASQPIGGHFRVGEIHSLLTSLEMIFGISATPQDPQTYVLSRKDTGTP